MTKEIAEERAMEFEHGFFKRFPDRLSRINSEALAGLWIRRVGADYLKLESSRSAGGVVVYVGQIVVPSNVFEKQTALAHLSYQCIKQKNPDSFDSLGLYKQFEYSDDEFRSEQKWFIANIPDSTSGEIDRVIFRSGLSNEDGEVPEAVIALKREKVMFGSNVTILVKPGSVQMGVMEEGLRDISKDELSKCGWSADIDVSGGRAELAITTPETKIQLVLGQLNPDWQKLLQRGFSVTDSSSVIKKVESS